MGKILKYFFIFCKCLDKVLYRNILDLLDCVYVLNIYIKFFSVGY